MAFTNEELEVAIRNADAAGNTEDAKVLVAEYVRRQKDQVDGPSVEPVEQVYGEDILAYTGAVPFKRPEMAEVEDSGLKLYDENLSPLENVKLAVYDINNQFNRTLLNTVGAPIDLIGKGVEKVKGQITGGEYVLPDYSSTLRDLFSTAEEEPRTPYGYVGQTGAEFATLGLGAVKTAQVASDVLKPVSSLARGTVAAEVADQFAKEATENAGRFLAVETGAFTLAGAARAAANEADLSPGASLAIEVLSGIAGGFGGYGAYQVPKSLLNKVKGKNATEIAEMVSNGTIKYDELNWVKLKDAPAAPKDAPAKINNDKLYRGGSLDESGNVMIGNDDGMIFLTSNKKLAETYGPVQEFDISGKKIHRTTLRGGESVESAMADVPEDADVVIFRNVLDISDELDEEIGRIAYERGVDESDILDSYRGDVYVLRDKSQLVPKKPSPSMPGEAQRLIEFDRARREMADSISNKQKAEAAVSLNNPDNYDTRSALNPKRMINKILKTFAPSKLLGSEITNEINMAKGTVNRAQELGSRVMRAVGRLEKKDPTVKEKVNDFINGGELHPSLNPIEVELTKWKETINELQGILLQGMDDEVFEGLGPGAKKELRETIEASMKMGYTTRTYKIFQDPDYMPTKAQEDAALKEMKMRILYSSEAGTVTVEQAEEMARKQMNYLRKNSARQKKIEGRQQGIVKESKGVLRKRTDPGPAERAWLGEVTDPKEKAFSTANRLARLASAKAEDIAIARLLIDSGTATRQQVRPDQVQMKLRTIEGDSSVFIDPEVSQALDFLRFGDAPQKARSGIADYWGVIWNSWVGYSKSSKVLFNPESYAVNLYGAIASTMSSGINPFSLKGFRYALSDFGSLDDIISGKNPDAKRAFLDDVDKMNQYGLKPKSVNAADLEQNVIRGLTGLNKKLRKGAGGVMDWFGKAYSVSDTSMRYLTWKGNQKQLKNMFPDYSESEIEAAAARLTNDTFQNYDKLSNVIRQLSRAGLADQFVPFTAELTRNMYNSGKYATQMLAGRFGKEIGLDPSRANKKQMVLTGVKRGSSLAAITAGSDLIIDKYNEFKGISQNDEKSFGESIAPEWDSSKRLIIVPDETGRKGRYINPSYLIPQAIAKQGLDAGFSESPIENTIGFILDQYIGEPGTFPARAGLQVIFGRDINGKLISVDPRTSEKAKDAFGLIYAETLRPGVQNTIDRWSDTLSGISDRTVKDNALRMLGIRDYQWDAEKSFTNKLRGINEPMRLAKSNYSSALRKFNDGKISREELDSSYEKNNTARRLNLDIMRQHYRNLAGGTWKYSEDERIVMMKSAGVSSRDILDIVENTYTDIPLVKRKSTADIYNEIEGDEKQVVKKLEGIANEDPILGKKLIDHHKRMVRINAMNISEVDKLVRGLSPEDRADRLIKIGAHKNRALMKEMIDKGIATRDVLKIIHLRGKSY